MDLWAGKLAHCLHSNLQYLGDWFTQLTIATPYNRRGTVCQRAQYGFHANGTISVHNIGLNPNGEVGEICGWAGEGDDPGAKFNLKVFGLRFGLKTD